MQFKKEMPEPGRLGIFSHRLGNFHESYKGMVGVQSLLDIFRKTKEILCKYDYYIYTTKRVLHLTNSELKIPHLMGMQYIGRPNQFTGDFGVYSIKKKRITHESIEKLVRKYYHTAEKQRLILEMIYRKLNNLPLLEEMFCSYSRLYLYEKYEVLGTEFDCDYLMVHESGKALLHLGLVKSTGTKGVYHCNSFMATYRNDRERDLFFCNLSKRYEISKIVREDKQTKEKEVVYLNEQAKLREMSGIAKMLTETGIEADEKLIKYILHLNVKFGEYHTPDMLLDAEHLIKKCRNKRDEALVKDFISLWKERIDGI